MNKHFLAIDYELGKAAAMMAAVENALVELEPLPEDREKMNNAAYLFYSAWDAIKKASEELGEYQAECRIVDVIRANREANGI